MELSCPVKCMEYNETAKSIADILWSDIGLRKANLGLDSTLDDFSFHTGRKGTYCVCNGKRFKIA